MNQQPPNHGSNRREFLSGRSISKAVESRVDVTPEEDGDAKPVSTLLTHLSRRAMATEFEIYLNRRSDYEDIEAALEALELLDSLENMMSVYREQSDLSVLNRTAQLEPQVVDVALYEVLQRGQQIYRATNGAFDMTATPLSKLWGFHHREGRLPDEREIQDTLALVGGRHVILDDEVLSVRYDRPLQLDLGAIGKGYALDRLAQSLLVAGIDSFLLHGGLSSVRASGCRDGRQGWRVKLNHPLTPAKPLGEVELQDQSLATSGCGNQFFYHRGKRLGHIIDPRSGYPVEWQGEGVHSATVIAPDAMTADALATGFYVMGVEAAESFCEEWPEIAAIFVVPARGGRTETVTVGQLEHCWEPVPEQ